MEERNVAEAPSAPEPIVSRLFCWTVATLVFAGALCGDAYAQLNAEEETRLARGEIVAHIIEEPGAGGRIRAAIDIPAPASFVWRVMLDCARAPLYVPGLESCAILEAAPDGSVDTREHRVRWIALAPPLTLRFRSQYLPEREIRVTRTGGDLAIMQGLWRLEPRQEGRSTRLHYDFRIAPRTPLPAALVRAQLRRETPRVLAAVRAEVARRIGP
jgi:hypothetical protein